MHLLIALAMSVAWSQARPAPPGTPPQFQDQRPRPPYAIWPREDRVFDSRSECMEWYRDNTRPAERISIRRFDAVYRRCEATGGGWTYRESHAHVLLDPVLEPLLLVTPLAVALARRNQHRVLGDRGLQRWDLDCTGDDCDLRYDGFTPPTAPVGQWRTFSDVLLYSTPVLALSPLLFSRGNARLTDTVIMVEVLAMATGITESEKRLSAEPRPYAMSDLSAWSSDELWLVHDDLRGNDAWASSPSGHTSLVAATTFGLATLAGIRTQWKRPAAVAIPFALAAGATALQGSARVLAVRHDPLDVTFGALTGIAVGVFVPLSHSAIASVIEPERIQRRQEKRAGRRVSMVPTFTGNGVGVMGVW